MASLAGCAGSAAKLGVNPITEGQIVLGVDMTIDGLIDAGETLHASGKVVTGARCVAFETDVPKAAAAAIGLTAAYSAGNAADANAELATIAATLPQMQGLLDAAPPAAAAAAPVAGASTSSTLIALLPLVLTAVTDANTVQQASTGASLAGALQTQVSQLQADAARVAAEAC
ncbi:MAG TPA: hypothetical protein VGG29_03540 [Caulobacteraceae bacterium]